jgi:hypothetical protein
MITALRELREMTQDDIYGMQFDGSGVESVTGSVLDPDQPAPPAEGLPDWGLGERRRGRLLGKSGRRGLAIRRTRLVVPV